jgi:hypothetical protein
MNVVAKSSSIASLGLGRGVHWLKVVVADDTVAYEVTTPFDVPAPEPRQSTGFVEKWGGTARKMDVSDDVWLDHINQKHLR